MNNPQTPVEQTLGDTAKLTCQLQVSLQADGCRP